MMFLRDIIAGRANHERFFIKVCATTNRLVQHLQCLNQSYALSLMLSTRASTTDDDDAPHF